MSAKIVSPLSVHDSSNDEPLRVRDTQGQPILYRRIVDSDGACDGSAFCPLCFASLGDKVSAPVTVAVYIATFQWFQDFKLLVLMHHNGDRLSFVHTKLLLKDGTAIYALRKVYRVFDSSGRTFLRSSKTQSVRHTLGIRRSLNYLRFSQRSSF